jgi:hypothetical protein
MRGEARCPVCGHPAGRPGAAATCAKCGWTLNTRPRAGTVTEDMRRDFDAGLRAARKARAERDEKELRAALSALVAAVRPDSKGAVVAVGLDGIELITVSLDAAEVPRVADGWRLDWADVLPGLPRDKRGRDDRLIDGLPALSRAATAAFVRDRLPRTHAYPALIVCRPKSAQVLEAAAEAIAGAGPAARLLRVPGLGAAPVRDLVARAAAWDPLRRPYYLLTAHVDARTGDVRPVPRQLFATGTVRGARARLPLRWMPEGMADITLAVFAGNGRDDWSRARPLALYRVPLPEEADPEILAVLDGPGRVSIARPAGADRHPDPWPDVFRQIPARVVVAARSPVDLVCAIDLSGTADAVGRRKALARDLIHLASREYPGRRLRAAIVTCTDHVFGRERGGEYLPVIDASELDTAEQALEWLAGAKSTDIKYRLCAPVEDLLKAAGALIMGSMRLGRRPGLLVLAGRPPHPFPEGTTGKNACPRRIDWKKVVPELDEAGVRRAVVVDELPPARSVERAEWSRIGSSGQHSIATATVGRLADDLGLLAPRSQRVPLPLTDRP